MAGTQKPWWKGEWDFKKGRYVRPGELKPVPMKPVEVKPVPMKPVEVKPLVSKPEEVKASVQKPGEEETTGMVTVTPAPVLHDIDKDPSKFAEFPRYDYIEEVIKYTQAELLVYLPEFLFGTGYYSPSRARITKDYLYFEGDIPVLLIAHLDTVHHAPVSKIYQHIKERYLMAREGIGGDDRCGVFAILYMVAHGKIPYILFTTDEETGAQGATVASKDFKPSEKVLFMVEIDRRGKDDSVYYQNDNKDFKKYIDAFGFKEATGSFSDIGVLGKAWNIASVNLSSGYYSAHSTDEKIHLGETMATAKKVMAMFDKLPDKRFEHVAQVWGGWDEYDDIYGGYYNIYGGYGNVYGRGGYPVQKPTAPPVDEISAFKGIPLKHLKKANDCVHRILNLPFVDRLFFGSSKSPAKGAIFFAKGDETEYWVADLGKRSLKFSKMMAPETFSAIQPCISFLAGMYAQHANFEKAIGLFNHAEKKWTSILEKPREKVQKPSAREVEVSKGGPDDFDDLVATDQRQIVYETMDCVEGLLSLPFVIAFSIEKGRSEIKIKTADYYISAPISAMVKDERFNTLLKAEVSKASDADAFINCLNLLDYRLKTLKGLDDEISKEVELSEKKLGKGTAYRTRQAELKVKTEEKPVKSQWQTMPRDLRLRMLKKARNGLTDIASLKFVFGLSYDDRLKEIFVNYNTLQDRVASEMLGALEKSKDFNDRLEKDYRAGRVMIMIFIIWASTQMKAYPEMYDLLAIPDEGETVKRQSEKRKGGSGTSPLEDKILDKVVSVARDKRDIDSFFQMWKESGMDAEIAFVKFTAYLQKGEKFFDDAPSCKAASTENIVDRFDQPEYEQRTRVDRKDTFEDEERGDEFEDIGDEVMDFDDAIQILMSHFDKYNFYIDTEDVCASMFIDDNGVERPLKDLKAEVDSIKAAKNRRILKVALGTLLRYG